MTQTFVTSSLGGDVWSASLPGRFGIRGPKADLEVMEKRKILPLLGNRTPAAQPVARCYTD
jgi:hypothetical protein